MQNINRRQAFKGIAIGALGSIGFAKMALAGLQPQSSADAKFRSMLKDYTSYHLLVWPKPIDHNPLDDITSLEFARHGHEEYFDIILQTKRNWLYSSYDYANPHERRFSRDEFMRVRELSSSHFKNLKCITFAL